MKGARRPAGASAAVSTRTAEVVPYDPGWPRRFEATAAALRAALGVNVLAVHHIGSTAVPGLAAKPILDVLPVVADLGAVDRAEAAMAAAGFSARGENGLAGRRYFVRATGGRRTDHVHVYADGDAAIARHLAVRDFLRAHPDEAARYGALKTALASTDESSERYAAAKEPFVADLKRRALAWAALTGRPGTVECVDAESPRP